MKFGRALMTIDVLGLINENSIQFHEIWLFIILFFFLGSFRADPWL
jgi:hypothetical protein